MAENQLVPFKRVEASGDTAEMFRVLQVNLEQCLQFITETAIIDGRLLVADLGASVITEIAHGLGRRVKGGFPVAQNAAARIEVRQGDSETISVFSTAAVTCKLWVF